MYNKSLNKVTKIALFEANLGYIQYLLIDFLIDPTDTHYKGILEAYRFT
jgi:hypothetical protein